MYGNSLLIKLLDRYWTDYIIGYSNIFNLCYNLGFLKVGALSKEYSNTYLNKFMQDSEQGSRFEFINTLGLIIVVAVLINTGIKIFNQADISRLNCSLRIITLTIGLLLFIIDSDKVASSINDSLIVKGVKELL